MKTILLISLILAAMVSVAMSAETLMTIETNTTIRIDPITGQINRDAETHVKGIRKVHEAPDRVKTPDAVASSTNTGTASTAPTLTTPIDPNAVTTPAILTTPTTTDTTGTVIAPASSTTSGSTSPSQ
ncbi:MAG: hypothetical protein ACLQPD_31350 [Desulfomonilaceae bacterium]